MSDFLNEMQAASRERAERLPRRWDDARFDKPVRPLRLAGFDLIAEIKDRSPAEGQLATGGSDRGMRARAYAAGGAAAISVLTEPSRFAGSLDHLEATAGVVDIPVLRKDFLVDVRQVHEARAHGASGVLLIAALLDDALLNALLDCACEHGMFVLLESFDAEDLQRSAALLEAARHADRAASRTLLIGINTRNLRSLEVDTERLARLAPALPAAAAAVAESGLRTAADAARVAGLGYTLGLVGTALMRSDNPRRLIEQMLGAGRARLDAAPDTEALSAGTASSPDP